MKESKEALARGDMACTITIPRGFEDRDLLPLLDQFRQVGLSYSVQRCWLLRTKIAVCGTRDVMRMLLPRVDAWMTKENTRMQAAATPGQQASER